MTSSLRRRWTRPILNVVRTSPRLRAIALALASIAVIATPALLLAHARLVRSTPSADSTLTTAPTSVTLWFSERPELRFSTIRLLDSARVPVTLGDIAKLAGDPTALTAPISAPLANGRYTVQWRTAADDGHATLGRLLVRRRGGRTRRKRRVERYRARRTALAPGVQRHPRDARRRRTCRRPYGGPTSSRC